MDLIEQINGQLHNLLPYDGTVHYYGPIMSRLIADDFYNALLRNIQWKNDEAIIYGKKIITKRKVAWYADQPFSYTYSKITKTAEPWLPILNELKRMVEKECEETFNSCLLNLYHDGNEGMAWHSDAEKDLKKNGAIASLSFGAERKFSFKHKNTKEILSKTLQHGSLLVMKDATQSHWLHRLPPTKIECVPRINLTFRTIESN
ncbi:alpha-ketoglutarate-dependent dioxygenase AlkB [Legionella massiliensis]|uniref:Alpha-ketoglutarate-dependent dioxygenase AlkB n=1 Tax=Legionella massiliensis TaxID=1034943 RepID=A0A078KTZ8_9GAMM|nr:alpha-ketoglutarate-dependent dioxygenase AlkB [Legionella massiliensis]CDZ76422.1 alpha-ketoglutarate-dependent dioxygenase AlkB [Legionella massiliensis]CEE12160.1 hypothetical protein BN1094_00691 [Legionella massiliensis]